MKVPETHHRVKYCLENLSGFNVIVKTKLTTLSSYSTLDITLFRHQKKLYLETVLHLLL